MQWHLKMFCTKTSFRGMGVFCFYSFVFCAPNSCPKRENLSYSGQRLLISAGLSGCKESRLLVLQKNE